MKRAFRKMFNIYQESPEEREVRERLEFFRSLPLSEQRRLALFFQECFGKDESGRYEFKVERSVGTAA